MAVTVAQIQTARSQGHSDQEILDYLTSKGLINGAKAKTALSQGYAPKDILDHFSPPTSDVNTKYGPGNNILDSPNLVNTPPGADINEHTGESIAGPISQAGVAGLAATGLGAVSAATEGSLTGFLTRLATSAGGGAVGRWIAEKLHAPNWAQNAAEALGGLAGFGATGEIAEALRSYHGPNTKLGFIQYLMNRGQPELVKSLIEEPAGVTGGTPISSGNSVPKSPAGPSEPGPGFSGTKLPPATGQGGNPQSVPPVLVDPQGRPLGRSITPSGAPPPQSYTATPPLPQYSIPGVGDVVERTPTGGKGIKTPDSTAGSGPTGVVPTAPGQAATGGDGSGISVTGVRPGYEKLVQSVADKVVEPAYNKAVAIAKYLKTNNIDPASVTDRQTTSTAAGYSRPINDASWQRMIDEYSKLPASDAVATTSNNESTTPLEDKLKKSITKAKTAPKSKAAPATVKGGLTQPLPQMSQPGDVPITTTTNSQGLRVPVNESVYTYGGNNPQQEFKRIGPGQWGYRDYGSSDPFTPSATPSINANTESDFQAGDLKPK